MQARTPSGLLHKREERHSSLLFSMNNKSPCRLFLSAPCVSTASRGIIPWGLHPPFYPFPFSWLLLNDGKCMKTHPPPPPKTFNVPQLAFLFLLCRLLLSYKMKSIFLSPHRALHHSFPPEYMSFHSKAASETQMSSDKWLFLQPRHVCKIRGAWYLNSWYVWMLHKV